MDQNKIRIQSNRSEPHYARINAQLLQLVCMMMQNLIFRLLPRPHEHPFHQHKRTTTTITKDNTVIFIFVGLARTHTRNTLATNVSIKCLCASFTSSFHSALSCTDCVTSCKTFFVIVFVWCVVHRSAVCESVYCICLLRSSEFIWIDARAVVCGAQSQWHVLLRALRLSDN